MGLDFIHRPDYYLQQLDRFKEVCFPFLGVVHLDLKALNIFLRNVSIDGFFQDIEIKIGDFGISSVNTMQRHSDEGSPSDSSDSTDGEGASHGRSAATKTHHVGMQCARGTTTYMSPERLATKPSCSRSADVWSYGATMVELISGRVPYDAEPFSEVQYSKLRVAVESPMPRLKLNLALKGRSFSQEAWKSVLQSFFIKGTLPPGDTFDKATAVKAAQNGGAAQAKTQIPEQYRTPLLPFLLKAVPVGEESSNLVNVEYVPIPSSNGQAPPNSDASAANPPLLSLKTLLSIPSAPPSALSQLESVLFGTLAYGAQARIKVCDVVETMGRVVTICRQSGKCANTFKALFFEELGLEEDGSMHADIVSPTKQRKADRRP